MLKKLSFFTYISLLHILFIAVIYMSFTNQLSPMLSKFLNKDEIVNPYYEDLVGFHSYKDGNLLDGVTIFVGDSITQGLAVSAVASPSVNYGIGADTTLGVLKRLPKYKSLYRAKLIVLAIGINDLKYWPKEETLKNFKLIIDQLPTQVPVLISAILPIDENSKNEGVVGSNAQIIDLNAHLKNISQSSDRLFYSDVGAALIDASGNLSGDYHIDGIHLNKAGYNIWIQELRKSITHIDTVLAQN